MEKKIDLCGMGNALVDIQYRVDDDVIAKSGLVKGEMRLASSKEQASLIEKLEKLDHHKCSGGSAANTIIAFSQFGGKPGYQTMLGKDENGEFYAKEFKELGIELSAMLLEYESTGTCLVLITPDSERTMYTCLAASSRYTDCDIDFELITNSKWIYIEGYCFSQKHTTEAIFKAIDAAREAGSRIAVTFSDVFITANFHDSLEKVVRSSDLLFCNEPEAKSFTGKDNVSEAMEALSSMCPNVVITLGSKGALVRWDGKTYEIPPYPVKPVDSTGAGDMFAGGFLYGIIYWNDPVKAGKLASLAASKVISAMGARLDTAFAGSLLKEVD